MLKSVGRIVGMLAVDKDLNIAMAFNTEGMFRAYIKAYGSKKVLIYK
jgi:isoaspartyl peptidase/L-asparaginase-like protein (Ntn-hydrolase superfamily)